MTSTPRECGTHGSPVGVATAAVVRDRLFAYSADRAVDVVCPAARGGTHNTARRPGGTDDETARETQTARRT